MHFPHYPILCLCFLFFAAQLLIFFCYAQWPTPDSDGLSWRFGDRVSFWGTWNVETMITIITCYNLSPSHKCHFVHKPFLFLYPINHIYRYNSPTYFIALPFGRWNEKWRSTGWCGTPTSSGCSIVSLGERFYPGWAGFVGNFLRKFIGDSEGLCQLVGWYTYG